MTQNRITKVPVVVYQVQADGLAPFLVRAQPLIGRGFAVTGLDAWPSLHVVRDPACGHATIWLARQDKSSRG